MDNLSNIVVFKDGELELKVSVNEETIWLTQKQIAEVFGVNIPAVSKHIKNIYNDKELSQFSTVSILEIVQREGNRKVNRIIKHYNLEAIICVGYRISSFKATRFRQWATTILKKYILNGYTINAEKITNERFVNLENDVNILKSQMGEVKSLIRDNKLETTQGIFYDGQIYDAYSFINDLLKLSQDEIILIDNYIDDSVLTLFSKYPNIKVIIYTNTIMFLCFN